MKCLGQIALFSNNLAGEVSLEVEKSCELGLVI